MQYEIIKIDCKRAKIIIKFITLGISDRVLMDSDEKVYRAGNYKYD